MRILICILLMVRIPIQAQEKDKWQRVYTGDDAVIDMKVSQVTFEIGSSGRVKFRTILSKPEILKEMPGVKYKRRLETIEFRCGERTYRVFEATLLDSKGQPIQSYEAKLSQDWKILKAEGMMGRLFASACKLIAEKRRNP
jgi:hypothetical protein